MKTLQYLALLLSLTMAMASCSGDSFKIDGKLANFDSGMVRVIFPTDSGMVDEWVNVDNKGKFSYKGAVADPVIVSLLDSRSHLLVMLVASSGDHIKVKGDAAQPKTIKIKGSKVNEDWQLFRDEHAAFYTDPNPSRLDAAIEKYVREHPADLLSTVLLMADYSDYSDVDKINAMLKGIDVMVYDIQDVGSRSYTFISTMGLVMRACAEQGIEVVILDRPNPLGGNKVEGCYTEPGFHSFVSEFKIPYIYGLTPGELAILLNEEGLNCGEKGDEKPLSCKLTVIPMEGWHRYMRYTDTKLPWILPSPQIPSPDAAIGYPSAGIAGEFQNYLNIGVGYTLPFQVFAAEWIDADKLKARLDSYNLTGVAFRTIHYKPFFGNLSGKDLNGVQYFYTDYEAANVTLVQFYVMQAVGELYPDHNPFLEEGRLRMFDIVCGTDFVRKEFGKRLRVEDIESYWMKDVEDFKALSRKYYLYK